MVACLMEWKLHECGRWVCTCVVCIKVWQVGVYMCGLYKSVAGGCVHVWFV